MIEQVQFSVGVQAACVKDVTFKQKHEGSEGMQIAELQAEGGANAEAPHWELARHVRKL